MLGDALALSLSVNMEDRPEVRNKLVLFSFPDALDSKHDDRSSIQRRGVQCHTLQNNAHGAVDRQPQITAYILDVST